MTTNGFALFISIMYPGPLWFLENNVHLLNIAVAMVYFFHPSILYALVYLVCLVQKKLKQKYKVKTSTFFPFGPGSQALVIKWCKY